MLRVPEDFEALADTLHQRALELEAREIGRLEQVVELLALDHCLTAHLARHFGEEIPNCGHCSWCLDGEPAKLDPPASTPIDPARWAAAEALRADHPDPLAEPRAFARFLTGLTSPRLGRQRLTKHPLFGSLARVPFGEILERVGG